MMWNFLVGGLLTDATIVLYDGNPATPTSTRCGTRASTGMTCFGTSAAYIAACMKAGSRPADGRDLCALRVGRLDRLAAVRPRASRWVYEHVGSDTWLFSTSGGTDVCTAFVGGVPTLPVYGASSRRRALGAEVEAWDEDGKRVVGEVGELVITEPMPSMPVFFWGDADGERYRESYFAMFPGVWRHGDWIEITERGTAIISGRSRLDDQPRRHPDGNGGDLPRRARARRDRRRAGRRHPAGWARSWMPLFVVLARAPSWTTTS